MRQGTPIVPMFQGGGQEQGLRPGTENTPMIAGLGTAASLVSANLDAFRLQMTESRNRLFSSIKVQL